MKLSGLGFLTDTGTSVSACLPTYALFLWMPSILSYYSLTTLSTKLLNSFSLIFSCSIRCLSGSIKISVNNYMFLSNRVNGFLAYLLTEKGR